MVEPDIILVGLLMDAIFGGSYLKGKYFKINNKKKFNKLIYDEMALQYNILTDLIDESTRIEVFKSFEDEIEKYIQNSDSFASAAPYFKIQNRGRKFIYYSNLAPLRLKTEDRNPPYDYDFMDFVLSIPREFLYNHRIYIEFLKRLNPAIAKVQNNHTNIRADAPEFMRTIGAIYKNGCMLLRKVFKRYTKGRLILPFGTDYPDYGEWLRKDPMFTNFVSDILLDGKTLNSPYFNGEKIKKLLKDHLEYKADNEEILFRILTFELWYRMFIERVG